MKIEPLRDADEAAWDAFVREHPAGSIYHLAGWRHLIAEVFGHGSHHLLARDEAGAIAGVLPLVRVKGMFGDYMVSLPYFTYGGPLGASEAVEAELMHAAGALAGELGVSHVEFRGFAVREPAWPVRTDKVTLHRPLAADEDGLWKSLSKERRRQVKKAQDGKSEVLHGGAELLDDFYAPFARNMRDLGTPVYGKSFFAAILARFPEAARIVAIRRDGRAAGAAFLIGFRDRIEVPWVSTVREMNPYFVNTLLYWEQLRYAVVGGLSHLRLRPLERGLGHVRLQAPVGRGAGAALLAVLARAGPGHARPHALEPEVPPRGDARGSSSRSPSPTASGRGS